MSPRPKRDLYVVAIPKGAVRDEGRPMSRAAVARYIRRLLERGDSLRGSVDRIDGVRVWPETREQTDAIARGLGLSFGRVPGVAPGENYFFARDRRTGAAPSTTIVPARRAGDKVRKPAQSRRSARAGS